MSLRPARENLGIPRQPSNLWTHVFGKSSDTLSSTAGTTLPPLGPIDKTATSTRVLLYDTQANLEKFSARVDTLLNGFSEAKSEVKFAKLLFERDRETLTNDITDLVNRSQTQIQKTLGSPAQSSVLDPFSREVSQRLDNLDKRLDAIQTLSQTHAQSLQTQIQAIQAIQEQQCTMLAAITPLIPLLQAIPLHIDSAKNSLLDAFRSPTPCHAKVPQASLGVRSRSTNKRPRTRSLSDQTPHGSKRSRIDPVPSYQSVSPPVQNRTDPTTTPKLIPRRPSAHNCPLSAFRSDTASARLQTPGRKPRTPPDCTTARTLTPAREAAIQISAGLQHMSTLGSRANTQQLATTSFNNVRNPFPGRTSMTGQEHLKATFPQSDASLLRNTQKADTSPTASNSSSLVMLAQQVKNVNDLRRTSTQMAAPQSKTFPAQGPQGNARQLKSAMTIMPSKNILPPPRRRRSPPKGGRRFIPLLDSDDEDIASP